MRWLWIMVLMVSYAANTAAENLDMALIDAYRQNPTLLAKQAELRAIDESLAEAMSGYRPSLRLDADTGYNRVESQSGITSPGFGDRTENLRPRSAGVTLTQPLFRGGRTMAATNQANFNIQAGQADLWKTEQSVLLDAVTAYVDVWRDRAVVELNINNQKVLQRQLDAVQDRFAVGELTRTDVAQAESRLERARAGVITAQGNLLSSQTRFQRVVGRLPAETMQAVEILPDLPATRDDAVAAARQNNPLGLFAKFRHQAAKEAVDLVRGEELPEINLQGSANTRYDSSRRDDQSDDMSVLAQLSFPLYQGGAVMARSRAAKQTASQRQLETMAAEREVSELAGQNFDAYQTARANIEAFQASLRAAEIALDGVRQEQEVGSRTVLDVLDAEQELLDTKVNLLAAERDKTVAVYALYSSLGRLTAAQLRLPVEIYKPENHYEDTKYRWIGY